MLLVPNQCNVVSTLLKAKPKSWFIKKNHADGMYFNFPHCIKTQLGHADIQVGECLTTCITWIRPYIIRCFSHYTFVFAKKITYIFLYILLWFISHYIHLTKKILIPFLLLYIIVEIWSTYSIEVGKKKKGMIFSFIIVVWICLWISTVHYWSQWTVLLPDRRIEF